MGAEQGPHARRLKRKTARALLEGLDANPELRTRLTSALPPDLRTTILAGLAESERVSVDLGEAVLARLPRDDPNFPMVRAHVDDERRHAASMGRLVASLGIAPGTVRHLDPLRTHVQAMASSIATSESCDFTAALTGANEYERVGALAYDVLRRDPRLPSDTRELLSSIAVDETSHLHHVEFYAAHARRVSGANGTDAGRIRRQTREAIGDVILRLTVAGISTHGASGGVVPMELVALGILLFSPRAGQRPLDITLRSTAGRSICVRVGLGAGKPGWVTIELAEGALGQCLDAALANGSLLSPLIGSARLNGTLWARARAITCVGVACRRLRSILGWYGHDGSLPGAD